MLAYKEDELIDGFQLTRNANFSCVCYQISKACGSEVDEITAFLNGYNVSKPSSTPTIAIATLGFLLKNEKWIVQVIKAKKPDDTFKNYMNVIREFVHDPHYNLNRFADDDKFQFYQELATQFNELLIYDVRLCLPVIEIE